MGQKTQPFKRSMSGSIGAGMKSVFGGDGRRFYVLEHKVSSKYHKAGEEQKIIVDQVEIGRDPNCAVRLDGDPNDKMFQIVSRKHAAIQKEGDNWVLIHLSNMNSTFLNGRRMSTPGQKWYLQNGDEIQIAESGPKMGFKIPQGDKGLVKTIGLTARLNLFRQQALRPYKKAITALACVLIVGLGVSSFIIWLQGTKIKDLERLYTSASEQMDQMRQTNSDLDVIITDMEQRVAEQDSIIQANRNRINQIGRNNNGGGGNTGGGVTPSADIQSLIASVKPSVYYIETIVYLSDGNQTRQVSASSGTGFLLDDGRFVTARHCVESWLYGDPRINALNETYDNVKVWSEIRAYGVNGDDFKLKSSDFTIDHNKDLILDEGLGTDENGHPLKMRLAYYIEQRDPQTGETHKIGTPEMWGTDWAVARTGKTGIIKANAQLSGSLTAGHEVHVLGFPVGLGVQDGQNRIEPIYNKMSVARDGINRAGCIMVSQGVNHGNSGGPVFAINGNQIFAIAIVSRLESASQLTNADGSAIQQQAQQYDQLIPIKSIQ